jgi:hypothetical protein
MVHLKISRVLHSSSGFPDIHCRYDSGIVFLMCCENHRLRHRGWLSPDNEGYYIELTEAITMVDKHELGLIV